MKYSNKITEIYFIIDEFYKELEKTKEGHLLSQKNGLKRRNRKFKLTDSEVICILTLFHISVFRKLKTFYIYFVKVHLKGEFPETVSYNRFVELQQKALLPMALFLKPCCLRDCTEISFIDSTPLRVCHIKREKQHKTFKDNFHNRVFGKLFGDKGYISKDLFEQMFVDGVHLVTKIRKNMKNCLMLLNDKIMLRKRAVIKSVNDALKNDCNIEHTRHRSFNHFVTNMLSSLIAYSFFDKKTSIFREDEENRLAA